MGEWPSMLPSQVSVLDLGSRELGVSRSRWRSLGSRQKTDGRNLDPAPPSFPALDFLPLPKIAE